MDRRLWIITFILFVNVLGVGLILPLLPFFALNLGASPLTIGFFISTLPFFSILSGPPLGALSDRYGRKPILIISIAGTVVGFFLLGIAKTLPMLFLARIVDGISAGNMSTAKAAIADITSKEERVTKLGFTFAAESLGLIMGPVLGGVFSQYGFTVSAYIAAGIALLCLLLTIFFFPETRKKDLTPQPPSRRGKGEEEKNLTASVLIKGTPSRVGKGQGVRSSSSALLRVFLNPRTQSLILMVFIIQLLIMMMWGTLALYGNHLFGFTGREMGYISAFAALAGIFSQTVLLKGITRIAREKVIIVIALLTMGAAMALIAFSSHVAVLLAGVGLMAGCFNVAMPTVVGLASRHSAESEQGNLMGVTSAMINIGSLAGPVFANAIYSVSMRGSYLSASALGLLAALVAVAQLRNEDTLAGEQEESPG